LTFILITVQDLICLTILLYLILYCFVLRVGDPVSQYVSYRIEPCDTQPIHYSSCKVISQEHLT